MDSILTSTKKQLGIGEDYEAFDDELIIHINSAFMILYQMGVGPSIPFSISNKDSKWTDFTKSISNIEAVKTYVYLKTKLMFDHTLGPSTIESINRQISEFEWRLHVICDFDDAEIPETSTPEYEKLKGELIDDVIASLPDGDEVNY